ncbi:MAG: hypothetical protein NC204_00455 [Candidatus Amulumruptor caecigallinarius]|nr:hypothetical protein [Candidatus Amulumruptor caecigallinarius]
MSGKHEVNMPGRSKERLRKIMEHTATVGLLLVAAATVAPFANMPGLLDIFKWIYAAGALIYTVARMVNVNEPTDSLRVRRMRRMEMWAGFAFCTGAFFWFFNSHRFPGGFSLKVIGETVTFTLAGALIQIISSWMLVAALKKQEQERIGKR